MSTAPAYDPRVRIAECCSSYRKAENRWIATLHRLKLSCKHALVECYICGNVICRFHGLVKNRRSWASFEDAFLCRRPRTAARTAFVYLVGRFIVTHCVSRRVATARMGRTAPGRHLSQQNFERSHAARLGPRRLTRPHCKCNRLLLGI